MPEIDERGLIEVQRWLAAHSGLQQGDRKLRAGQAGARDMSKAVVATDIRSRLEAAALDDAVTHGLDGSAGLQTSELNRIDSALPACAEIEVTSADLMCVTDQVGEAEQLLATPAGQYLRIRCVDAALVAGIGAG